MMRTIYQYIKILNITQSTPPQYYIWYSVMNIIVSRVCIHDAPPKQVLTKKKGQGIKNNDHRHHIIKQNGYDIQSHALTSITNNIIIQSIFVYKHVFRVLWNDKAIENIVVSPPQIEIDDI